MGSYRPLDWDNVSSSGARYFYVAVLIAVGLTAGWAQAQQETTKVKDELGQRYIRVLDPYQVPRQ